MGNVDTELVLACIVLVAAVGIALLLILEIVEKFALPWQQSRWLENMAGSGTMGGNGALAVREPHWKEGARE